MLADILVFLSYYPNFLRQVPALGWAIFAAVCLWQAAISWSIYRQTGMRSYVGATVGSLLVMAGGILGPIAGNLLQLILFPAPLLLAGFIVLSLSDARSWFSSEAGDKYYLVRRGGLRLRVLGLVPQGFVHRGSAPASWLQGVLVGGVTLLLVCFLYFGVWRANEREAITLTAFGWITLTCGLLAFHCLALLLCGLLFGSSRRKAYHRAESEAASEPPPGALSEER